MGIAHLLWANHCSYHLDIDENDIFKGSPRELNRYWPLQLIELSLRGVRLRQMLMPSEMDCSCNLTGESLHLSSNRFLLCTAAVLQMAQCFLLVLQKLQGHPMYLPVLDRFLWFFKSGFSFIYYRENKKYSITWTPSLPVNDPTQRENLHWKWQCLLDCVSHRCVQRLVYGSFLYCLYVTWVDWSKQADWSSCLLL